MLQFGMQPALIRHLALDHTPLMLQRAGGCVKLILPVLRHEVPNEQRRRVFPHRGVGAERAGQQGIVQPHGADNGKKSI